MSSTNAGQLDERQIEANAIVEALTHVLGNTCRLVRCSRSCAWNVRGRGSIEAGRLFAAQSRELYTSQDCIAKRIFGLNGVAIPAEDDALVVKPPSSLALASFEAETLASLLLTGHQSAIMSIEAAVDVAGELADYATRLMLESRLVAHQDHVVALKRLSH